MSSDQMNAERAEAFAETMTGTLNSGCLMLLVSVGHRTGLFDTMAALPPSTTEEVAEAAGLDERYVREWLAGMTVGRIVEHDPEAGTYALPPEHAACLTRDAGPDNLAAFAQFAGLFGEVESDVVEAFRHGRGVPYSRYPRFQALMAEDSAAVLDASLIDAILPLVPGLVERLERGAKVLDVGCGQGHAVNLIGRAFPASSVVGYDLSEEGIAAARSEASELGLENVRFEVKNATTLDEPGQYDLVTAFDVIHDLPQPEAVLRAIHETLVPDGVFLMVDIAASSYVHENLDHPLAPLLYAASVFHCMSVSLAQGGPGLGTVWGEQKALEMLRAAGFGEVAVEHIESDVFNSYYVARKG
jgi:2-polyprenyl-3-methyl-5-hydroxy-6-metoxy-1,4-benzoquinol methylase